MNRKHLITLVLVLIICILTSCKKDNNISSIIEIDDNTQILEDEAQNNVNENDDNSSNIVESDDTNKVVSSLNGLKYTEEQLNKRPIVVSIDNHPRARMQAGLSEAEIVYEVEAEAPYTRYLAVFQTAEPKLIGPVRSARPYLIYLSLEYNSLFAHVGGSAEAFEKLYSLSVADIDGLYTSAMWRYYDTNKSAPHNLYTTIQKLREDANSKNYKQTFEFEGYKFNDNDTELNGDNEANNVKIVYNRDNTTEYVYDVENKVYIRYKDNEKHLDENDNKQITAKNIIIYSVDKKVLDNEGRLYLGVVGQGTGYYITDGKAIEITWKKDSEKTKTYFYHNDEEIKLNPGNTWIQVINKNSSVDISK